MKRSRGMLKTITVFTALSLAACTTSPCSNIYGKVGAGFNFENQQKMRLRSTGKVYKAEKGSPITARFEVGAECWKHTTVGFTHNSQWLDGWPLNDNPEPSRTEFFYDRKFIFLGH